MLGFRTVMAKVDLFVYKDADKLPKEKCLYEEVKEVLQSVKRADHREIQAKFYNRSLRIEERILGRLCGLGTPIKPKLLYQ